MFTESGVAFKKTFFCSAFYWNKYSRDVWCIDRNVLTEFPLENNQMRNSSNDWLLSTTEKHQGF